MNKDSRYNIDDELIELVSRYRDDSLDSAQLDKLENRLKTDAGARDYCAECLRYDAEMQQALGEACHLELSETRNVILKGKSAWEIQRTQSIKYGDTTNGVLGMNGTKKITFSLWLFIMVLAFGTIVIYFLLSRDTPESLTPLQLANATPTLIIRNPSFEATDLTYSKQGSDLAVVDWQDYFTTTGASVAEISRTSEGKIYAKSGRNVACLREFAYLTQRLRYDDGSPLLATPGLKVNISGWAYVAKGNEPCSVNFALRFVATSKPGMIQYEANKASVPLSLGGWQKISTTLEIPDRPIVPYSDIDPGVKVPPELDLTGRELTLSIDSRCKGGVLLLDDLSITKVESPSQENNLKPSPKKN